jgi:ribonuclease D
VQIAIRRSVYLIQIKQPGIEDSLIRFLENPAILKAGIALRDDLVKLREIRDFDPAGFIDISDMAARKGIIQTGVRALSARYLEGRISKSAQTSNWERRELTEQQKRYAATDAWACLEIYPLLVADQRDYHEAEPDDESTPVDETAASASNED